MEEIWKDIPDYEGFYKISNKGRILRLERVVLCKGKYPFTKEEKILSGNLGKNGYLSLCLSKNGTFRNRQVHQLVAMAFLNHVPCGHKLVVNHINFIKTDNRLENLEIITQRENSNKKHVDASSKFVGVHLCNRYKKWVSSIFVNGKVKSLGSFDSELEASKYYENALISIQNGTEIKTKPTNFTSKYSHVNWCKSNKRWKSYVIIEKVKKNLGSFKTEEDAYQAILDYKKLMNL